MSEQVNTSDNSQQSEQVVSPQERTIRLVDVSVTDQNVALNLMVAFLNLAQKRGAYTFEESGKIWECVNTFTSSSSSSSVVPPLNTETVAAESGDSSEEKEAETEEELKARLEALESQLETPRE